MRFLLKQKLRFKKENTLYYIFPNQYSSQFIRIAKKLDLIFDINERWENNRRIIESYEILENDFKKTYQIFRSKIEEKRKKFFNRPFLEQLILVLRYIFNRNQRAKEVSSYSRTQKAYNDKQEFLELALNIAKKIRDENFSYGWALDPSQEYYKYIYYFQYKDKQVSFHSKRLYSNYPKFKGQWIGYRDDDFPFKLHEIKILQK